MIFPKWEAQPWFPMIFTVFTHIFHLPIAEELFLRTNVNSAYPLQRNPHWEYLVGIRNINLQELPPFPIFFMQNAYP